MSTTFSLAATPQLFFGSGKVDALPSVVKTYGNVLLVTGEKSFASSEKGKNVLNRLTSSGVNYSICRIGTEPTPLMIDEAVKKCSGEVFKVVVAIGGGSVLDAGKAISAMLGKKDSVKDFLEGVGTKNHTGSKVPFIAIPTTAGTGSEATKNAVISEICEHGYKRSLRHNNFVPDIAIVDPMLTVSCPPFQTATSGMDAFTQLLESYLSTQANPITDALALEGLHRVSISLMTAYQEPESIQARTDMAMAAYLSGVTLANAGLGLVHGYASSVGGFFDIPHGVICSALMGPANKATVAKLRRDRSNDAALTKYAAVGKLFGGNQNKSQDYHIEFLLAWIATWSEEMQIPKLSSFGLRSEDYDRIAPITDNKNNPVKLDQTEIREVLSM